MILLVENVRERCHFWWFYLLLFIFFIKSTCAQNIPAGTILKGADNIAGQINKIGDEAKAKYAENIDNPYIPNQINTELNDEAARLKLIEVLKKYVNYYYASKVPAYRNLKTNFTIRNIKNGNVTDNYIMFTSGKENHSKDTVYINYKDIINRQIVYYVKITDGGFYMPYVKVGDHLITCGGKEFADLIFYMQHKYAVKKYEEDYERFKTIAANYQKLSEKPVMSEEQRKLFIQGNTIAQVNYDDAMVCYEKAIALDAVSCPASYYNYALIAALTQKYELAIFNMKKYLLLFPDAEDVRTSQDKIYEWESYIKK